MSVVVPVYNGASSLPELVRRTEAALAAVTERFELILVNDGSRDESWRVIEELATAHPEVEGIDLTRNFGQHNALLAGIREARNEICVTIDDDLQNPPEEIPVLLEAMSEEHDVLYGEPILKRHGIGRRLATKVVVHSLRLLGGETAPMVSSFRAFRTELRDGFADYTGPDVSIDALLTWQTDRFGSVKLRHDERAHGASNYSPRKLVRHALTMITAFSTRPLRLATTVGFFAILFGIAVLVYVIARLAIEQNSVPGFPFLASIISIFAGAQLFAIGVIGEYLARVHVRAMSRPSYAVRTHAGAEEAAAGHADRSGDGGWSGAGEPPCRRLAWDSEFWGFPVARAEQSRLDRAEAERVVAWCEAEGIRCAFLLAAAGDAETAAAATAAGFTPTDTRVTLEREPGGAEADRRPPAVPVRDAESRDAGALAALAGRAHTDTRFYFDSRFPSERAGEMYARWVGRGFEEESRRLLVAAGEDGAPLGYLLLRIEPAAVAVELIAVEESARGRGIGRSLVAAALAEYPGKPFFVVTQARNVEAMRFYEGMGFRTRSTEVWYHRWQ